MFYVYCYTFNSLKTPIFFSFTEMQENHMSEEGLAISQRPVTRGNHAVYTKDTIPLHLAAFDILVNL